MSALPLTVTCATQVEYKSLSENDGVCVVYFKVYFHRILFFLFFFLYQVQSLLFHVLRPSVYCSITEEDLLEYSWLQKHGKQTSVEYIVLHVLRYVVLFETEVGWNNEDAELWK